MSRSGRTRDTLGQHRLADTRRTMEEHVMPAGGGNLTGPLRFDLLDDICQVEAAVRVPIRPDACHLNWLHDRHRLALEKGTN